MHGRFFRTLFHQIGLLFVISTACPLASIWLTVSPAVAADRSVSEDDSRAARRVVEALQAEAEGDLLARQRLLVEAESSADFAPAKWHRGKIQDKHGDWEDIPTSVKNSKQNSLLDDYERRRASLPDNFQGHFSIASWCAQQGLLDQCRAHLSRVLAFDPDNTAARRALGYVAIGREWIGPEQMVQVARQTEFAIASVNRYGKQLQGWLKQINSPNALASQRAADELMRLKSPGATPAVEAVFASPEVGISRIAVTWFGNVDAVETSKALARYTLFHPQPEIRMAALHALKTRPLHDFVPDMLALLSSPVSTMIVPAFDRNGALTGYRQAFSQEKYDKKDFVVFDRAFPRENVVIGTRGTNPLEGSTNRASNRAVINSVNEGIELSLREFAAGEVMSRTVAMQRENNQVQVRNTRIAAILSQVADEEFSGDAKEMWQWWDRTNETKYQAYKPERYQRSALISTVPTYDQPSHECFVAGTPVLTQRGMKNIELVVVGDSVLSRDVSTAELSWKPVVRVTNRPPEATIKVSIGKEQLRCTAGHLLWVSGKGWSMASEIKPGDILHAVQEPVVVTEIQSAKILPTFNLEVADTHVYFVGESMVMTHDVTPRRHTRQQVPGQDLVATAD